MSFKNLLTILKEDLSLVEQSIKENFKSDVPLIPTIGNYISNGGGKRIRPLLVLASSKLCGYNNGNRHITYACVVEYLHIATLLHDDVLDEATTRRGHPAVNQKWGNEASILVGDFLFSKSFSLMAEDNEDRIIKAVAQTTKELSEGEVMQLIHEGNFCLDEEKYLELIKRKTAVLISVSCKIGAILGKVSSVQEKAITSFGYNLGMAFQLVDDLLDYYGEEKKLGKDAGNDLKEKNITLPFIHLYQNKPLARGFLEKVIKQDKITENDFNKIKELMEETQTYAYVIDKAKAYIDQAKKNLEIFKGSDYYKSLYDLADYIVDRDR